MLKAVILNHLIVAVQGRYLHSLTYRDFLDMNDLSDLETLNLLDLGGTPIPCSFPIKVLWDSYKQGIRYRVHLN